MSPEQLAKPGNEHSEQAALFCWVAMAMNRGYIAAWDMGAYKSKEAADVYGTDNAIPELRWYHSIPNGGSRGDTAFTAKIQGGIMKAEGVKPGVSDTFLPVARGEWHGLYVELKKGSERKKKNGGASEVQLEFGEFVKAQGYGFVICYSWREAASVVQSYLTYK